MNLNQSDGKEIKNRRDPTADSESAGDLSEDWATKNARMTAVTQCYDWFVVDREAKSAINAEFDEMYKLFKSDHWDLTDSLGRQLRTDKQKDNHPNAVENMTFSLVESMVAEFSEPKEIIDYPVEKEDEEMALTLSELKEYIGYKNRLDAEYIKWLRWFFLYGTGIWSTYWDPSWKGGKGPNRWNGDIRWQAEHPRSIFPDARCLNDFEDGRRLHKAIPRTIEDIEETWPDAKGITPDSISDDIVVNSELEETGAAVDEDQALVVDTWYRGVPLLLEGDEKDEGPGLHLIQWAGEGSLKYLNHANYVNDDPGEDDTFPIKGYKCYERERSPWGMGEAYQLKNPQIVANKTAELILEGHMHEALGQTWYESGAVTEKQKKVLQEKGTLAGMWLNVEDVKGITRVYGKGVPASLENEAGRLGKVMEMIVGRFDISQGKTPGNVTAFRALDLLNTRAQVRLRSKDMTIALSYEDAGNYMNKLIARNYNEKRKYRILGKDDSKPKWGEYDGNSMKKAYFFDTNETMPASDLESRLVGQENLPEEEQMIEGQDYEIYSPEFDTKCKLSSKMASDRVFYMEMAKELFNGQLIPAKVFFYVIEHGKFPPYEELMVELEQMQQLQMQQAQGQQALPPGTQQPAPGGEQAMDPALEQQITQFIEWLKGSRPDILQEMAAVPEQDRVTTLMQKMMEMIQSGEYVPGQESMPPAQGAPMASDSMPQQMDPKAIKQQLIDIALAQQAAQG